MRKAIAAALVVAFAAVALADTIKRKDGSVVEGEITSEDDESVTIKHRLGDITIKRADIESIERKPLAESMEGKLEAIKKDVVAKLWDLAVEAEKAGKKDAARALRENATEASQWSTRPRRQKPEEDPKPDEATKERPLDFAKTADKWKRARDTVGASGTKLQRDEALEEHLATIRGKPVRATCKLIEAERGVRPGGGGKAGAFASFEVVGTAQRFQRVLFEDEADVARVAKMKKGDTVVIEGVLGGSATNATLWIDNPHLAK